MPNTTCLPFKWGVATVVMKNCEPFVFLPALAMDKSPPRLCLVKEIHRDTSQTDLYAEYAPPMRRLR